jgi:RHS repeat-associated protein
MELSQSQAFSEPLLAAMPQLKEKPCLGVPSKNPALYPGQEICNSTIAIGLQAALHLDAVRSRYTGKERDAESGNDYFGARYYGSSMGRFLSPDEANLSAIMHMDDPQSWNGYAYGRNNPLKYVDPDGNNYHVCDQYGQNCSDQTDADFAQNMKNAIANGEHWGGGNIELADGSAAGTYVQTYEDSPGLSGPANVAGANLIGNGGMAAVNFFTTNMALQVGTAGLGVALEAGADAFRGWRMARMMAQVAQAGREGEAAVQALEDIGPKTAIQINGRTRIPDGLTDTAVNEVKNVSSLAFTRQLRDFADFASQTGRQFNLWVPGGTQLSGPLQAAIAAGKITLKTF